ncbi:hypothetical protein [Caldicellulosiruptor changbaiensis]
MTSKKKFLKGLEVIFSDMECINCGNCKVGNTTYFCFKENGFVVDVSKQKVVEKVRSGWKKGDPEYEKQRRRSRKEVEV